MSRLPWVVIFLVILYGTALVRAQDEGEDIYEEIVYEDDNDVSGDETAQGKREVRRQLTRDDTILQHPDFVSSR